jgi:energy-coupling factor transporter ATP-binding protein EcfA2
LQVIQIFAYIVYFRPKLVLIDEPDAHLHPDKQERLIEALERAAREFDTQIVLTTHSPHIARAATSNAKLVWMAGGEVRTDDDDAIRRMLGWGGLDREVLFFVEDKDGPCQTKSGPIAPGVRLARQDGIPSEHQSISARQSPSAAERLCL